MLQAVLSPGQDQIATVIVVGIVTFLILTSVALAAIRKRRGLAAADRALANGRLADAVPLLIRVIEDEFHQVRRDSRSTATFARALAGLQRAFATAGQSVDLSRLKELYADMLALHCDKRFICIDVLRHGLNADGWTIRARIDAEVTAFLDGLPALRSPGEVPLEDSIRPQNAQ